MLETILVQSVLFPDFDENDYNGSYKYTAVEAQNIRNRVEELEAELAPLEKQYESVSGGARAALTRKMTPLRDELGTLKALLKTAPPAPVAPQEIVTRFLMQLKSEIEAAEKTLQDFADEVSKAAKTGESISRVIGWQAESVAKAEARLRLYSLLHSDFDSDIDLVDVRKWVNKIAASYVEKSLQPYREQSTNGFANELEETAKYERRYAVARSTTLNRWHYLLNDDSRHGWDAYITWKHLQAAQEAQ